MSEDQVSVSSEIKKCKHGHEMTDENTYKYPESGRNAGKTLCRSCMARWGKTQRSKISKEQANEKARLWRIKNPDRVKRAKKKQNYKKFGLTIEAFNAMADSQGRVCKICLKPEQNGNNLAVDHNHKTGRVRGLLCSKCNTAIGLFYEQPLVMEAAIKYLQTQ